MDPDIVEIGMEMMFEEDHPRRWHPAQHSKTSPIWHQNPSELIKYNTEKQINQLQMKPFNRAPQVDKNTMVVHIDGVCQSDTRTCSYGVYFGPDSKYNKSGILEVSLSQTKERAEIEALSKALDTIYSICDKDYSLTSIHIAIASKSLFKTITEDIYDWVEDGGVNANGKEVKDFEILKSLHEILNEKEYGDDGGIEVKFWYRSSEENQEAAALALL